MFYSERGGNKSQRKKDWDKIQRKPCLNRNCIDWNALYKIRGQKRTQLLLINVFIFALATYITGSYIITLHVTFYIFIFFMLPSQKKIIKKKWSNQR